MIELVDLGRLLPSHWVTVSQIDEFVRFVNAKISQKGVGDNEFKYINTFSGNIYLSYIWEVERISGQGTVIRNTDGSKLILPECLRPAQ